GAIVIDATRYSEDELMVAVEAGAEDISTDEDVFEVITEPADFTAVRTALEGAGVQMESAEMVYRPSSLVPIDEGQAGRLMRLIEVLEENDDVDAVHANFDVPAEVLERGAGCGVGRAAGRDPLRGARHSPATVRPGDPQAAGGDRRDADPLARDPALCRAGLSPLSARDRLQGRVDRAIRG